MTDEDKTQIKNYIIAFAFSETPQDKVAAFVNSSERYYQYYYNFIVDRAKDTSLAYDLTQELFLKIAQLNFKEIKHFDNMSAYFFQMASHTVTDWFRALRAKQKYEMGLWDIPHYDDGYEEYICKELLAILSKEERELYCLKYEYGYTLIEMEQKLGIPKSTISYRIIKIKEKLMNFAKIVISIFLLLLLT
jgi:RNA polymerase sigma factor (sigma-70 family)